MTNKPDSPTADKSPTLLSEDEIFRLIENAKQQYEEFMRLADLADLTDAEEVIQPKYAWDNPLGFDIAGHENAKLV